MHSWSNRQSFPRVLYRAANVLLATATVSFQCVIKPLSPACEPSPGGALKRGSMASLIELTREGAARILT
jgi:hypothetical protein